MNCSRPNNGVLSYHLSMMFLVLACSDLLFPVLSSGEADS
jgi:hypothetical protein